MLKKIQGLLKLPGFVYKILLADFLAGLTFWSAVLIPFFTNWGHITLTQVQLLQSWFMIWVFILNIPTGVFADRFGRKKSIFIGSVLTSLSYLLYAAVPGFASFLFAEFVAALGVSFMVGANNAFLYDLLKDSGREEESKHIFGMASSVGQVGAIIAALLGSLIASKFGLNAPMYVTAIPSLLAGLVILTVKEVRSEAKEESDKQNVFTKSKEGIKYLLHHKQLRSLVISDVFIYSGAYFLIWLYQPMLQAVGLAIIYFGLVRSSFSLMGMFATARIGSTIKLFGSEKNFVNYSAVLTITSLFLVALIPSIITVIIAVVVIGWSGTARTTYLNTIMNEFIPSEHRATILSAISTLNTLVFAIMNPIVGILADHSLRLSFFVVGLVPLIVLILLPYSKTPEKEF